MPKFLFMKQRQHSTQSQKTKRALVILVVVGIVIPLRSLQASVPSKAESLMAAINDPVISAGSATNNGKGDTFVQVLKSPVKAISGLFGRGKRDDNKLHRLSEKDVEKFEVTPIVQINDATSEPANEAGNTKSVLDHLERGRFLLNSENLNDAIFELSLAIAMDRKLAEAHSLLGVAYGRKGFSELAHKSLETAVKLDKKNEQILNNLGYLLFTEGDYKGSEEYLKKASRLAPRDPRILNNLASAQSKLGKFDEAYENFARAGGEVNGRVNIANQLALANRSEEALKQFQAARLTAEEADDRAQEIEVVIEIRNGFVTFASIAQPRPGLAAYEASALRIARKRRYPSGKNGQESVLVKVVPFPNS